MWTRTNRRLFSGAVAVVAGLAAGWWQWSNDDAPTDQERIAGLDGVASVEYDPPDQYVVALDPGATTEQISALLSEARTVLQPSDDSAEYPMVFAVTDTAEYYVDLESDVDQMATVIASTEAADLAGADIDFDEDSLSQLTFATREELLADAQQLLSDLDRAGVADLTSIGVRVDLWSLEGSRNGDGPTIELDTSRTDVALRRLDTLAQALQRADAGLLSADLGAGDQVIEVSVPGRERVEPAARVFTAAYGEPHLDLTIDARPQPPRPKGADTAI